MLFVQNELYNTDGDEDEKGDIRYNDFFDEPPVSKRGKSGKLPTKTHGSVDSGDEDVDWDYGEDDYLDGEDLDGQALLAPTAHSIRSNKMNEQIALLEHELVTPKSWDLKGEVQAGDRPENSLLGIVADIDRSSKPAPIITQQYTDSIEDMIKKRIKEDNFDDIVPREATEEKRFAEEKEDFQLSQEKNKDGLADVSFKSLFLYYL